MEYERSDHLEWVSRINDEGRGLTAWEKRFVADMECNLDDGHRLSDRQEEILKQILDERVEAGKSRAGRFAGWR